MKKRNLDIERNELGMPNANTSFITALENKLNLNNVNKVNVYLTEDSLVKIGFEKEIISHEEEYRFVFTIYKNNTQLVFVTCTNKETINNNYIIRLFDTPFFMCKTIQDFYNVIDIAQKYK